MATQTETHEGTSEQLAESAEQFTGRQLRLTMPSPDELPSAMPLVHHRPFLSLPRAERRKLLAEQAERMHALYPQDADLLDWIG